MKNIITPTQGSLRVTLLRLFSLALAMTVTLDAFAQAPQGFNYQAVVLNSSGAALSNQTVSLQLSILDSSASGVAVYVETQNPTTDTTGLFSVVIGNGTVVTGNFSTINWGKNSKFLKTEIDTAGGSNYVLMGISQMMSVPYALYANNTKAINTSLDYPDGTNHMTPVLIDSIPFIVPQGKNLYLELGTWTSPSLKIEGYYIPSYSLRATIGASENQTVIMTNSDTIQGWLIDKNVEWVTQNVVANPITIPAGKIFVASFGWNNLGGKVLIDGIHVFTYLNCMVRTVVGPGQVISGDAVGQYIVNGYFRDE